MLSLSLGICAALAWAVHDLLVRRLGQNLPVLPMILLVLASGMAVLLPPGVMLGEWERTTAAAGLLAGAAGLAFVVAMAGLYTSLSHAPVRLVAPVVGAYPVLSLAFAAAEGRDVGGPEWLAVAAIVAGITAVARSGRHDGAVARPGPALVWAAASAAGFAATFWLAQQAGRQGGVLPTLVLTRGTALLVVAVAALVSWRPEWRIPRRAAAVLGVMGVLDAIALGLVTASAGLPFPEYASISSSLFGVLTILLAWRFLGESVSLRQVPGIAVVFAGIAMLSGLG